MSTTATDEGDEIYYDNNGFLVRPAQIGDDRGYNYDVNYLGYNGDGHFGRFNLTTSAYWAFGHSDHNQFSPSPNNDGARRSTASSPRPSRRSISTGSACASPALYRERRQQSAGRPRHRLRRDLREPAIRRRRHELSGSASRIPLIGGGGVALNQPNGVLADLRSSKDEGQSNFNNPGLDARRRRRRFRPAAASCALSTNFNYLCFADTAPLEFLRHQAEHPQDHRLGSVGRPSPIGRSIHAEHRLPRCRARCWSPADGTEGALSTPERRRHCSGRQLSLLGAGQRDPDILSDRDALRSLLALSAASAAALAGVAVTAARRATTAPPAPANADRRPRPRPRAPAASAATRRPTRRRCTPAPASISAAPIATAATPASIAPPGRAPAAPQYRQRSTRRMSSRAIPRPGTIRSSAKPQRSYTLLNEESPEFVRFVNPERLSRRARGVRRLPSADHRRRPSAA